MELHDCQVAVSIHVEDGDIDRAFEEIFEIRREIILALEFMYEELEQEDLKLRELKAEWKRIYSGTYSERDFTGMRQTKAVETIKEKLRPIARYEMNKK